VHNSAARHREACDSVSELQGWQGSVYESAACGMDAPQIWRELVRDMQIVPASIASFVVACSMRKLPRSADTP
jgi:hypothetical protein